MRFAQGKLREGSVAIGRQGWTFLLMRNCQVHLNLALRPYSFRNQVPLLQENRAEVRFHFGRFLFTEKDKIGAYDLMPSSELTREDGTARRLRYAARLTLTYLAESQSRKIFLLFCALEKSDS